MESLKKYLELKKAYIDKALADKIFNKKLNEKLIESMEYSLLAGGKRLRPILMIETYESFGGDADEILELALSMEMIHTYSLIHDDLPAMDNDDYRRGNLTNHKVFGEDIAILAGDGLLNLAYETMIEWAMKQTNKENALNAISFISKSAGYQGMIGGQSVDVLSEGKKINVDVLEYIQENKTSALIQASMIAPVLALGCDDLILKNIKNYSKQIGIAFQIRDDILDEISTFEKLGKDIGSDVDQCKNTYLSFYSKERAQEDIVSMTEDAIKSMENILKDSSFFSNMAKYLTNREY